MKHQMGGATQAQQSMTFQKTLILFFIFNLPWELDPSQNVGSGSVLKLAARWEPGRFSPPVRTFNPVLLTVHISGSHWVPSWKPTPVFSQWVRTAQHWFKHYYQLKIHNVFENSIAKKTSFNCNYFMSQHSHNNQRNSRSYSNFY
jgi:hypothetical protein